MNTIAHYSTRDNINERTARKHREALKIGKMYGQAWYLSEREWKRVLKSMEKSKAGNPNWKIKV